VSLTCTFCSLLSRYNPAGLEMHEQISRFINFEKSIINKNAVSNKTVATVMTIQKKYLYYFLSCIIIEVLVLLFVKNTAITAQSIVVFMLMTCGAFFLRTIIIGTKITNFIKYNYPLLYERNCITIFNRRIAQRSIYMDKDVVAALKADVPQLYTEVV